MKRIVLSILAFCLSCSSWSAPRKYLNCPQYGKIKMPDQDSTDYYFDDNCEGLYVLPSNKGKITISGYSSEVSVKDCKMFQSKLNRLFEETEINDKVYQKLRSRYLATVTHNPRLTKLKSKYDRTRKKKARKEISLTKAKSKLNIAKTKLTKYQDRYSKCLEEAGEKVSLCATEKSEIKFIEEDIAYLEEEVMRFESEVEVAKSENDFAKSEYDFEKTELDEKNSDLKAKLKDVETDFENALTKYKSIVEEEKKTKAAILSVNFESRHGEVTKIVESLNPKLQGRVSSMPLKSAIMSFRNVISDEDYQVPLVSEFYVLGQSPAEKSKRAGEFEVDGDQVDLANQNSVIFGRSVGAQLILNRFAACQGVEKYGDSDEDIYQVPKKLLSGTMNATVTYKYDLNVLKTLKMKRSMTILYSLIKKKSKSKGLFSTKTVNSLTEKHNSKEWIDIEIKSEDSDSRWENAQVLALQLRKDMVDKAIENVSKYYIGKVSKVDTIDTDFKNGANASADTIRKSCKNQYCQYTAAVLDLGSAMFASSEEVAQAHRDYKDSSMQEVTINEPVSQYSTFSFVMEN